MPGKAKTIKSKKKPRVESTIRKLTQELFTRLGFSEADIQVEKTEEEIFKVQIEIDPEESGILIGYHGETISSLQLVLSLIINHELDQWYRLSLNINDYRERREQSLVEMAQNAAERVKTTNEELIMPPMVSFDRRIIHLTLAEETEVKTESTGSGKDRRLIIYPTQSKKASSATD